VWLTDRLLKPGTLAGSLGVYVPAMTLHKAIGLARVLLFAHFLRAEAAELQLWYLGLMIFSVLAPLACLGSNHALARYASMHEARGDLRRFYRRSAGAIAGICLVMGLAALAARGPITDWAVSACQPPRTPHAALGDAAPPADAERQVAVATAAIANAVLMALYYNLLAFAGGLRLYRLVSAVEIAFGVMFAAAGCAALAWRPSGLALLSAHLACVAAAMAGGTALLHVAVGRRLAPAEPNAGGPAIGLQGFIRFSIMALVGGELWVVAGQLGFYLASLSLPPAEGAAFGLYRQLAEPVAFLAAAAWTVLYSHVARTWESGDEERAIFRLQAVYKAVAICVLGAAAIAQAASPAWLRLLDERWRPAISLLPGLLLFFQMAGNLGLMNLAAWLVERPVLSWLPPAAGIAANLALARWWMPRHGGDGAAWAAGLGMSAGGGLSAVACLFIATRLPKRRKRFASAQAPGLLSAAQSAAPQFPASPQSRPHFGIATFAVLLCPAAILPLAEAACWAPAAGWAGVLAIAIATPLIFRDEEKAYLRASASRAMAFLKIGDMGPVNRKSHEKT
jgi:O-antigen/teichoic acid export membrane protein